MGRNKPGSPHYSTPREQRNRKPVNLTLSPEALELLDELSAETGVSRSAIVEDALNVYKTSEFKKSTST